MIRLPLGHRPMAVLVDSNKQARMCDLFDEDEFCWCLLSRGVVEAQREQVEVGVHLVAQIVGHPLSQVRQQVAAQSPHDIERDVHRQQHQDIYSTDRSVSDDFTPQVSSEIMEERKREIRRHQFISFILGMTVLVLLVALVYVVVREYMDIRNESDIPAQITQEYIPRYSLPAESQWVLDQDMSYGDAKWPEDADRPPFDYVWVKKAAFNIVLGDQF